jgi:hypothetical protein
MPYHLPKFVGKSGEFARVTTHVLTAALLKVIAVVFRRRKSANVLDYNPLKGGCSEKPRRAPRGSPFRRGKDSRRRPPSGR